MGILKNVKQVLGFEEMDIAPKVEDEILVETPVFEKEEVEEKEDDNLVVPISTGTTYNNNTYNGGENMSDYQTIFVAPVSFEECKKIANYINKDKIVTINLEGLSNEEAQRLIDFLGGAMEVKKARFITVSKKVYVAVPDGINSYVEDENN
jgi:cell division inhibitor SepF